VGKFFKTDRLQSLLSADRRTKLMDRQWLKDFVDACPGERFDQLVIAEGYVDAYLSGEWSFMELIKALSRALPNDGAPSLFELVARGAVEKAPDKKSSAGRPRHTRFAKAAARVAKRDLGKSDNKKVKKEMERMGVGYLAPTDNSVKNLLRTEPRVDKRAHKKRAKKRRTRRTKKEK
jgi:hypothetical protein